MTERVYAFGYYGGKLSHLAKLLPLLPKSQTYVEPFAGSAAVLLNRKPSPVEVYNDLDGSVVNFFQVLREQPDDLIRLLELTPYSRAEFVTCLDESQEMSRLEWARRFFTRHNQSYANIPNATPGRWGHVIDMSRRNMAGNVSAWHGNIDGLQDVSSRLLSVQIECNPAETVIQTYDSAHTLFYIDPPYPNETREGASLTAYKHEMNNEQHEQLSKVLIAVNGNVAISSYASTLYDDLYKDWWKTTVDTTRISSSRSRNGVLRTEILWTNYDPIEATEQSRMFD